MTMRTDMLQQDIDRLVEDEKNLKDRIRVLKNRKRTEEEPCVMEVLDKSITKWSAMLTMVREDLHDKREELEELLEDRNTNADSHRVRFPEFGDGDLNVHFADGMRRVTVWVGPGDTFTFMRQRMSFRVVLHETADGGFRIFAGDMDEVFLWAPMKEAWVQMREGTGFTQAFTSGLIWAISSLVGRWRAIGNNPDALISRIVTAEKEAVSMKDLYHTTMNGVK